MTKYILAAIILPILVFLMGAFMAASFNIATWVLEGRFMIGLFMACTSIGVVQLGYLNNWK